MFLWRVDIIFLEKQNCHITCWSSVIHKVNVTTTWRVIYHHRGFSIFRAAYNAQG